MIYSCHATHIIHTPHHILPTPSQRLKWVVLGSNLVDVVVSKDGDLLHDVVAYLGYLGEEEEGKEPDGAAEATGEHTAVEC